MKTIKFIGKNIIRLNGIEYKGYNVGDLPQLIWLQRKISWTR